MSQLDELLDQVQMQANKKTIILALVVKQLAKRSIIYGVHWKIISMGYIGKPSLWGQLFGCQLS
jgi:hypothetical protein